MRLRLAVFDLDGTPRSLLVHLLQENPYLPGARETVAGVRAPARMTGEQLQFI